MTKTLPWDYHSDLSAERLAIIGQLVAEGRNTAVELQNEPEGDDNWILGCRAFQFARFRILRAIDSGEYPWLTAIDRSMQLIFKIGQVPARIYKGDADEPTGRTLHQSFGELYQLDFLFADDDEGRNLAYRFAVETDIDGSAQAVKFVGLHGETAAFIWDVPLDGKGLGAGTVGRPATETVELGAPEVGPRKSAKDTESGGE